MAEAREESLQMETRRVSIQFTTTVVPIPPSDDEEDEIASAHDDNANNTTGHQEGGIVNRVCSIEEPQDFSDSDIEVVRSRSTRKGVNSTLNTEHGAAVVVRDAYKSYAGQPVLQALDMTIPCGSIYSFLGASGCGKTTALSVIVGTRKLDSGDIWLFGNRAGNSRSIGIPGRNIGYMPQDICLYTEFSIAETLVYFGTLCGMTKGELETSIKFLGGLLDLPNDSQRVGTLRSTKTPFICDRLNPCVGGKGYPRMNFPRLFFTSPELIILDEPTVGVDALLREKIWTHLQHLVSTKRVTVILTTHYIQECNLASNVAFMRNGRLITERPPSELMSEFGTHNLEKAILALCRRDTPVESHPHRPAAVARKKEQRKESISGVPDVPMATVLREPEEDLKYITSRITALTGKNFVIVFRNLLLLFFVVWIAAFELFVSCIALGGDPSNLSIGVVNKELDYYAYCPNISRVEGECNVENLSCHFLAHINKNTLDLKIYETDSEALTDTKKGVLWGYIVFPHDFSTLLYERATSGNDVDLSTINASDIIVRLDETNKQVALPLKKAFYDAYQDFIGTFLTDCGFDPRQGESVLRYNDPVFGKDDTDYREYLTPSLGPPLIFFFAIITSSIRYIREKKSGMLERGIILGVSSWEILVAYSISELCVLVVQSVLIILVIVIFQIQILGSIVLLFIIIMLFGYGGIAMGFMLGTVCNEEIQAAMLAMAAFFPNMICSGLVWPLEGMPEAFQYVAKALPCALAAESIRSIVSRGWEFTHPNVWPGFVILVGYIFGYFVLTVLFHKFIKR